MNLEPALIKDVELKKSSFQGELTRWGSRHFRSFPWRIKRDPYSVLISEILLRRTTSSAVMRIYQEFLLKYPNVQELANADCRKLERFLAGIGFQKQRARMLIEIGDFIIKAYDGNIPDSREQLLRIPYVGDYTASAISTFAYDVPATMVDSNIERIMKRVFMNHFHERSSFKVIQGIAGILSPDKKNRVYNYALLDLGALVCSYRTTKCEICPLKMLCDNCLLGKTRNERYAKKGVL